MKKLFGAFALLLIAVFALVYMKTNVLIFPNSFSTSPTPVTPYATIDAHTFSLFLAKTEKDKEIGLSKYSSLPQDKGMLFFFDTPGYYGFWMKDMKFSIDMIFMRNNKIVTIFPNLSYSGFAQLQVEKPQQPIDKVLEINAGLSKKYNMHIGDDVKLAL